MIAKAPTCGSCQHYIVTSHGGGSADCLRGVVRLRSGVALDTPACDQWDLWQEPEHQGAPENRVRLTIAVPRLLRDLVLPIDEIRAVPGVRVIGHTQVRAVVDAPETALPSLTRLAGGVLIVESEIRHHI